MRQIKFRGVEIETGKLIYGDLIQRNGKILIHERSTIAAKYVKPDSVAQLVGHDKDGDEVYEGDTIYLGGKDYKFRVTISTSRSIVARSTLKEA